MRAGRPSPPSSSSPSPEPAAVRRTVTPARAVAWRDGKAIEVCDYFSHEEALDAAGLSE